MVKKEDEVVVHVQQHDGMSELIDEVITHVNQVEVENTKKANYVGKFLYGIVIKMEPDSVSAFFKELAIKHDEGLLNLSPSTLRDYYNLENVKKDAHNFSANDMQICDSLPMRIQRLIFYSNASSESKLNWAKTYAQNENKIEAKKEIEFHVGYHKKTKEPSRSQKFKDKAICMVRWAYKNKEHERLSKLVNYMEVNGFKED